MWILPLYLHFNQKSDYDDDMICIRAVSFVIIYIGLMHNHPFLTLPSRQCCIDNQNIHNTNNHMCLSCERDDILNNWY